MRRKQFIIRNFMSLGHLARGLWKIFGYRLLRQNIMHGPRAKILGK